MIPRPAKEGKHSGWRSEVLRLYNTKRAREMRLAIQEFIIPRVRQTVKSRLNSFENHCQRGRKLFGLVRDENKKPRCVFLTSEAFALREVFGSFLAQALSISLTLELSHSGQRSCTTVGSNDSLDTQTHQISRFHGRF
jgi:hypothetical protein